MSCNTIVPILFIMIAIGAFGLLIQTVGNDYARGVIPWKTAAILQGSFIGIIIFLIFTIGTFIF